MEWYVIPAIVAIGFIAGFMNTLAGGGSLLTLPMLIFLGVPANIANGINRIPLILQNTVGVASFKKQNVLPFKKAIRLTIPAIIGAIIGAQVAADLNEDILEKIIGFLLVFMFFIILYRPEKWLKEYVSNEEVSGKTTWIQVLIFTGIGFYGGFIQAGVGFFLLAALVLGAGIDLVRSNAIKLLIILVYNIFALAVFILNGLIKDPTFILYGLILAVGNMGGAYLGTRVAVSWGPRFIRIILLLAILASALELTGVFDLILKPSTGV